MKIDLPPRMKALPSDDAGRPVPWFVAWIDGKPDFRVVEPEKILEAWKLDKCWVCGQRLGKYKAFLIGPMCAINRTSSEPPCHLDCATTSAQICPFLAAPKMHRRERDLPAGYQEAAGIMLKRNPGVALVWVTKSYSVFFPSEGGILFTMGPPEHVHYFCEGRPATRAEVLYSIDTGLPILRQVAAQDGAPALEALATAHNELLSIIPDE